MNKEREFFEKNVSLSVEFSRYLFEHPELEEQIPPNAQVVILPEDEPELCEFNKRLAEEQREEGQPIVYVKASVGAKHL
jgi:hypothetical protein